MKFSDVFTISLLEGTNGIKISVNKYVASQLSDKDAVKYSRMKFQKILDFIKDWDDDSNVSIYYLGTSTCPLCAKYFKDTSTGFRFTCKGCPIALKTKRYGCKRTPYDEIVEAFTVKSWIPALQHEIAFLKSLE